MKTNVEENKKKVILSQSEWDKMDDYWAKMYEEDYLDNEE